MKKVKVETQIKEKVNAAIKRNEVKKHLWETDENRDERKMREYCKANAISNTHGKRKVNYYAVNRGIHTIEWKRENWGEFDKPKEIKNEMKNKIVLIYGGETGILEIASHIKQIKNDEYEIELAKLKEKINGKKKNTLNLPDKIEIAREIYETKELRKMLIENKIEIFEIA